MFWIRLMIDNTPLISRFFIIFSILIEKLQNNQIISREITWLHKFQFDFINILTPLCDVVDETAGSYYIFHGW